MIVTREDGALRLVTQVEHGRLAGELAAAWGGEVVDAPEPRDAVVLAAARHDEGWRRRDARLLFDPDERRPLHFLDVAADEHVRLYRDGIRTVTAADAYAGLLVGMHWTGLYRGRWARPGAVARVGGDADRALQDRAVRAEQRRWVDVLDEVWTDDGPRRAFESRAWHHHALLQLWDLLSLHLVTVPLDVPSPAGPPVPFGPQLRLLEHAPERVLLPPVAPRPGAAEVQVTAWVGRPGEVHLDPFPFAAPVEVEIEHVLLPDREWSEAEVRSRWRRAPREARRVRLVAGEAP